MNKFLLLVALLVYASTGIGQTYTFTTAGAVGANGPTQTQIDAAYTGTPLAGQVTSNGGIQLWTVPQTGMYHIKALGAQGGGAGGGLGASIEGEFLLTAGEVLKIVVGQSGASALSDVNVSGGGGSFVIEGTNNILIIAGGGGGSATTQPNADGSILQVGNDGYDDAGVDGPGGVNGNGGTGGSCRGGGGGGFYTDGAAGGCSGNNGPGGIAFVNGAEGGAYLGSGGANGGFGGGASSEGTNTSWTYAGGGGGYSGGGGGSSAGTNSHGGGGGSFNVGSNPVNLAGVQAGDGLVVITSLSSGATNDLAAISLDAPQNFCPGPNNVVATIQNAGTNQITSATINWSVNGAVQSPYNFNGTLDTMGGQGSPTAQVTLGSYNFTSGTSYNVVIWTSMPNGSMDTVTTNDSISRVIQTGISAPGGFTFNTVTSNSADFTWNSNPNAVNYNIIYGPSGFNPASSGTVISTTSTSVTIPGLNQNTRYDAYLYADCGTGTGGGLDTTGPVAFKTFCGTLSPINLPFTEDFENYSTQSSTVSIATEDTNFACTNTYIWNYDRTGNAALHWGWTAHSGTQSAGLSMEASGTAAPNFVTLTLDMTNYTSYTGNILLSFWMTENADEINPNDKVWIRGSAADPWIEVLDWNSHTNGSNWVYIELVLDILLNNNGQALSSNTQIRWGQEDNSIWSSGDGFAFDDVKIEAVACMPVSNFNPLILTDTSAVVAFDNTGGTYTFEYGPCGFLQGTGTTGSGTEPFVFGSAVNGVNLFPNTCYDVYVTRDCGPNGLSPVRGPFSFTTKCGPFTAPYFNDFESENLDEVPECWESYVTASTAWIEVEDHTGTAAPFSGSQALYLYSGNSSTTPGVDTLIAVLPRFSDLPAGDKRIRFFVNADSPSDELYVGTISAMDPSSTFDPVDTITFASSDTYQMEIVEFTTANGYNGTDEYIVLAHNLGGTFDYIRIDEFNYEEIPACEATYAFTLGVSGTTSSSADVFWGSGSQGIKTYIEVGAPGFTPGGTSYFLRDSVAGTVDNFSITGLSPQTTYEFYIQDSCSPGGLSTWVGPFSFTTSCLISPITLPFNDGFESYSGPIVTEGEFYCGSSFTWSVERPGATGEVVFSYSPSSGPSAPNNGSQSAGLASLSSSNPIYLILTVDMTNYINSGTGVELAFSFADHADEAGADDRVWARGSVNDPWIEIYDWSTVNDNSNWIDVNISLRGALAAAGQSFSGSTQIRWGQMDNAAHSGADGFSVDDVALIEITCPDPAGLAATGVSDTAATLNWVGSSAATTYQVWFGPENFYQGTQSTTGGVIVTTTDDSLLVDSLTSLSCYEYLVRTVCGQDTTAWVGPVRFCTQCPGLVPMTLPFYDGFENFNNPVSNSGTFFCGPSYSYSMNDPGGAGQLLFSYSGTSGPTPPYNGQRSVGFESNSSSDVVELVFTGDLSAYAGVPNLQMMLSFYLADHADETSSDDKVWVRGSQGDTWIEILDWNSLNASVWTYFEIRLDSVLAANNQSFSSTTQIKWGQMDNAALNGADGMSIDDLRIVASTCPDPSNLSVSNATQTSVDLSWTSGGAPGIVVEYGAPGFILGTGQKVYVTTTSPYTLTGLTPGTPYEFYLRDSCGVGDLSFAQGPVGDTTLCQAMLSGTYTIGGATANYPTFAAAAHDLNICGISGPVIFNVNPGIYTDNFQIYNVPGASATNTITINGDATGSEIVWDGNGEQATMLFSNTPYVTVNNMTVVNGASSEGFGILLTNNADNFTLTNSMVVVDSSGAFASDLLPFLVSGSLENDATFGSDVDNLTVTNSEFVGGYVGFQYYGNSASSPVSNLIFTNNSIRKFYSSGVYLYSIDGVQFHDNEILSIISTIDEDGLYTVDVDNFSIERNYIEVKDYGMYLNDANDGLTLSTNSVVINNMVRSQNDDGMYLNDVVYTDVYHNTVIGEPGFLLNDEENINIRNNIFVSENDYPFESTDPLDATTDIDYNLYYKSGTGDAFEISATTYTDLAAWVSGDPSRNANSVMGDPVFVSPTDMHVIGGLANAAGDNSVGVTVDIDGEIRPLPGSTIVDIGADEYNPPAGDLELVMADFVKGMCLSTNDSIEFIVQNLISPVDFGVDPLTATYQVTGPVNSNGSVTVNSGTLGILDSVTFYAGNIDLSIPGTYNLTAYIDPNAVNLFDNNDTIINVTIDVEPEFVVSPTSTTLLSMNDSVELCVESPFFGSGGFFFSEVSHYSGLGTGNGSVPSYVPDDYVEITGVPGSDLDGITFEQWEASGLATTYTFGPGTVIGPNGTAIIMIGSGAGPDQPSNYLYDGLGGVSESWSSSTDAGTILRDANGVIIDAVGYDNTFTFPAASGVTPADWSGQTGPTSGTAGIRLIGPDNNSASNWVVVSSSVTQDAQVLNAGVPLPMPSATGNLTWTLNGNTVDTTTCITVGPFTAPGTYYYIASFSNSCGSFVDTATVIIPSCTAPSAFSGNGVNTSAVALNWDSTGTGATSFEIEYGQVGFTPGSGTLLTSSATNYTVTGLTPNLCQEFYVRGVCGANEYSAWVGPINVCPEESMCDDLDAYTSGQPISSQSALFIPWQGASGDEEVSTAQSNSSPNSLHVYDHGPSGFVDVVAYFDTISSGAWNIEFDMFIPTGKAGYFNIQQNHDPTNINNLWGGEIYFQANGTAQVEHSNPAVTVGTFPYTQGQWFTMNTIIDIDNDTVWFEMNGTPVGLGYYYSLANPGQPLQFNGVNFYSGVKSTTEQADYYMDNFCVTPILPPSGCADPSGLIAANVGCDEVDLSWSSTAATDSSIVIFGTAGFNPATGGTKFTRSSSSVTLTGLVPGTNYEFYVMDICSNGDSSALIGPTAFTTANGPISASFTEVLNTPTASGLIVDFDASTSVGATSYSWDFGDGNTGTGMTFSHTYTTNGTYNVELVISGPCGTDSITRVITIVGISIYENSLSRSLNVYPNPATNQVNISFDAQGSDNAFIRITDLSGKNVLELHESGFGSAFDKAIDLSRLAKGVYMLEVENGNSKAIRRIIKE